MWHRLIVISTCVLSAYAIIVPIENSEESTAESTTVSNSNETHEAPNYYIPEDTDVDSYLIPPDPHKPQEVLPDSVVTPATYLLPPSSEQESRFFYPPTESGEQTDWYPIAQVLPPQEPAILLPLKQQKIPIPIISNGSKRPQSTRLGKAYSAERYTLGKPSIRLEPPRIDATNDYLLPTSPDQPETSYDQQIQPHSNSFKLPYNHASEKVPYSNTFVPNSRLKSEETGIPLHLTPPKPFTNQQKYPTNLYPKKYSGGFKPVPIPVAQFVEDPLSIPRAKPVQYLKPVAIAETDYIPNPEDKKAYLYKLAEQKRKLKAEEDAQRQPLEPVEAVEDYQGAPVPSEQDTSETNNRYPGHNVYLGPVQQQSRPALQRVAKSPPAPDERTEFRMHGMKGPHSYQFGYDTGKGKNRQFRYEERDNDGQIRGHYGYMDKHGKMRVVNYSAHPELGFHADPAVEKE